MILGSTSIRRRSDVKSRLMRMFLLSRPIPHTVRVWCEVPVGSVRRPSLVLPHVPTRTEPLHPSTAAVLLPRPLGHCHDRQCHVLQDRRPQPSSGILHWAHQDHQVRILPRQSMVMSYNLQRIAISVLISDGLVVCDITVEESLNLPRYSNNSMQLTDMCVLI